MYVYKKENNKQLQIHKRVSEFMLLPTFSLEMFSIMNDLKIKKSYRLSIITEVHIYIQLYIYGSNITITKNTKFITKI